jgi:hypothetical protein
LQEINILHGQEDRETALILATNRMERFAQNPWSNAVRAEMRKLNAKVAELVEVA